ncbi:hypothetical protein HN51_13905 [Ectopseudomonas mendocina]|uniref:LysR family transcriptional regulator n=1 Tax=Ectopseudomonas mendocina S5.2 TaxID=1225174 RepID=A0ABN4IU00_ECTME|nr:hypothetical protein DW68_006370 [Pseudomonas mendocina S5.2]KES00901.1 hypothetical protein HN51_13905 [Pseudomonas mendocina]
MRKLLATDRLVAVREGAGIELEGRYNLALVLSAHLTGQRPGQMSDCFLDFLATTTHAHWQAMEPGSSAWWSKVAYMKNSPLRESSADGAWPRRRLSSGPDGNIWKHSASCRASGRGLHSARFPQENAR